MPECSIHKTEYTYTCGICEAELQFVGKPDELAAFRRGFNGLDPSLLIRKHSILKSAYEKGKSYADTNSM